MSKSVKVSSQGAKVVTVAAPSLAASKAASKASSPVTSSIAATAATLVAQPATAAAPVATTVAVRGGLVIAAVALAKPYKVKAAHNAAWFATIAALASGKPSTPVGTIVSAGVPVTFVGYLVRRGYLSSVAA